MIPQKHTLCHSTASVSSNIKGTLARKYHDVNIVDKIWSVVSDTTGLEKNVVDHFDDASQKVAVCMVEVWD